MKRFMVGFLLGLFFGSVATVAAHLSSGYLNNWDVVRDGDVICRDPYIWQELREIECE